MDELVVAFALNGVEALQLGKGPQTDLLAVSLSATDVIGHRFGPDSREIHDQVLRVDRAVGVLLDSLFKLRDPSTVTVVLAADHGVGTIPELAPAERAAAPAAGGSAQAARPRPRRDGGAPARHAHDRHRPEPRLHRSRRVQEGEGERGLRARRSREDAAQHAGRGARRQVSGHPRRLAARIRSRADGRISSPRRRRSS